jgi:UDP-glucose 4-epimerase
MTQAGGGPTTYLITGGAGFIGSHLVEALLVRGDRVIVLDQLSTGRNQNLDSSRALGGADGSLRFVQGSVVDELVVDDVVSEADVVVHLAAAVGVQLLLDAPLSCLTQNIRGTEVVIDAAHRYGRKILIASTSEIYGKNGGGPLSEDSDRVLGPPTKARWAYSTAKAVNEIMAYAYNREKGLESIVVRFFNTVGPRQSPSYGMVIPRIVRQAVADEPITVFGDGHQTRCFCHVRDVVNALTDLLDDPRSVGDVFNIGGEQEISILALAGKVKELAASNSQISVIPYDQAYGAGFDDMQRRVPDTTKLRRHLGWAPAYTLDDILIETIAEARAEREQQLAVAGEQHS